MSPTGRKQKPPEYQWPWAYIGRPEKMGEIDQRVVDTAVNYSKLEARVKAWHENITQRNVDGNGVARCKAVDLFSR